MEAICSSETSIDFKRTTRRYIPEDSTTLHNHCRENLKSYNINFIPVNATLPSKWFAVYDDMFRHVCAKSSALVF
jgi:hypothetical protein